MNEEKRILITGGSGFIGQHLAQKFVGEGYDVTIFDLQKPMNSYGNFVNGDIFDLNALN
jgi:nucleoside-diphosphate-sugar epimerase